MVPRRLFLTLVTSLCVLGLSAAAQAQEWPQRPLRILVPYAAGGNSDLMARIVAQRLSESLKQQVVVENRLGANGALATEAVARAPADGYTLLWAVLPPLVLQPAIAKTPYDPVKDFVPITAVGTNPFVLVVNKSLPAHNVADFVSYVRARPNQLAYAVGTVGSVTHLAMALFLKRAGLEMTNVAYRGNAPALADVVSGQVPTMFSNLSDALAHVDGPAIRLLAVSGKQRAAQIPDVPTISESGYPGYDMITWNGLMAPAGTPRTIIDRLAKEVASAVKDAKFAERLVTFGVDPLGNRPDEFAAMIASDIPQWSEAARIAGIKPQ
ncbi:MAG TPA: tripartite tricarboxylate transporter substrate binding protein [Xanthobacteraceae bacterium]|nr:tripartite tricarboxylate transporter substrate binding protein [Xanthobacteraceae bacterium]